MAAAVRLRDDFDAARLRGLAKASRDPDQLRRLLSLAEIYDGGSRGDAARIGGVGLQTVRDWVLRFNAGGPEGLIDPKPPGKTPKLNKAQRQALVQVIDSGPVPAGSWCGALAPGGSGAVGLGGVPHPDQRPDLEPRAAGSRLSQALGPPAPLRPGCRCHGGL